ncbi:MAG: hypothetical protein ACNS63_07250 [Candidatus Nitrospinota bacterium M3_3B_026]
MEYQVKPLTVFSRRTAFNPLSRGEYEALYHPRGRRAPAPDGGGMDISTKAGRDAMIRSIGSGLGAGTPEKTLLRSLVPSERAVGGSYGLYAAVGEIPAYKMRPLIDEYV